MGSHPKAPSLVVINNDRIPLPELIKNDPDNILGTSVSGKFSNQLPFLFKILAAARPLSIQVHPHKAQAEEGFAREKAMGIPLDAPHRNYRDENHKPELFCAIKPTWTMKGFRRIEEIIRLMGVIEDSVQGLGIDLLRDQPDSQGLTAFFRHLMDTDRAVQARIVNIAAACAEKHAASDPAFEWVTRLNREHPEDMGVLSPLFLNLILLQSGEALHIPAGELHAYLEGAGIELMANSDNVLRGGLTPKHIDLPELTSILNFSPGETEVLRPEGKDALEVFYPVFNEEFMLSAITLHKGDLYESPYKRSVEIMICIHGHGRIRAQEGEDVLEMPQGRSVIVPAAVTRYTIEGEATVYKASVPL